MMVMIKEDAEQLSKQISSNNNNFIAHCETLTNNSEKAGTFPLAQSKCDHPTQAPHCLV